MTDQQLKSLFPKLLPWEVELTPQGLVRMTKDYSAYPKKGYVLVKDTELLSLCREVEETFTEDEWITFADILCRQNKHTTNLLRAVLDNDWRQHIQAAAEVRGIL